MRLKNYKTIKSNFNNNIKTTYNLFISWINVHINEQLKSKCNLIQQSLLNYLSRKKKTSSELETYINEITTKYLNNINNVSIEYEFNNRYEFDIYINFNNIYNKKIIENNSIPKKDGKNIILNIEISDEELKEIIIKKVINENNYEEI